MLGLVLAVQRVRTAQADPVQPPTAHLGRSLAVGAAFAPTALHSPPAQWEALPVRVMQGATW